MAEIKVTSDVAGRVCAISAGSGASVGSGDDIILIEAMKMEIPVPSPAAGRIKSLLVAIDDMVSEGQTIAVLDA